MSFDVRSQAGLPLDHTYQIDETPSTQVAIHHSPVIYHGKEPLTEEKLDKIMDKLRPVYAEFRKNVIQLQQERDAKLAAISQKRDAKLAALDAQSATLDAQSATLDAQSATLDAQSAILDTQSATLDAKLAALDAESEALGKQRAGLKKQVLELDQQAQSVVTRQFYSIFSKNSPAPNEISEIFQNHLANGALTFEYPVEGAPGYPQINFIGAVINFLISNPNFKTCDFRVFKDHISGIPTFAEFLKTSSIKAVAFKDCISKEAKASLAEAVAARNGTLKVQYFA